MSVMPDTRSSLIARICDVGDNDAWHEFAAIYEPFIYRQARRFGLQHADARELVQDVLIAVSKAVSRFTVNRQRARFRTWLYAIGRNISLQHLSRIRTAERANGNLDARHVIEQTADPRTLAPKELTLELKRHAFLWAAQKVRGEFQPKTWKSFWCTAVENQSVQSAADHLGISVGAVYIARSRVMARLRSCVQEITLDDLPDAVELLEQAARE